VNRKDLVVAGGGMLVAAMSAMAADAAAVPEPFVTKVPNLGKPIAPPKHGLPRVAVMIGPDTVSIDTVGPWEAFRSAISSSGSLFTTYTVAATLQPVSVDYLWVTPHYTFENAPRPNVVVIPAQRGLPASVDWVKQVSAYTDVIMSVCTGAFLLAETGLLDGLSATTHHNAYDVFEKKFPKIELVRGPRYVENRNVSSSGGESSGIDLALRVVERYYGADAAKRSSYGMEHVRGPRPRSANDV
jgi:transcriptional regulator GlxA family with amidase domain